MAPDSRLPTPTTGGVDLLWGVEDNGCKMTYMFEYPQYIELAMPDDISSLFPKYGLFAYGEGEGKSVERLKTEKFSGIPVLFIPGNSGSHKQVRSLASVALRMAIKKTEYKVHFDYFSVDFDEEHSAFYGGALDGQVEFVSAAVTRILALYKGGKNTAPSRYWCNVAVECYCTALHCTALHCIMAVAKHEK